MGDPQGSWRQQPQDAASSQVIPSYTKGQGPVNSQSSQTGVLQRSFVGQDMMLSGLEKKWWQLR